MYSDANIAVHLSIGPKVNGQQNLFALRFFLLVSVDNFCWRASLSSLWKGTFDLGYVTLFLWKKL